jgi:CRISPR/Cas system-associated exonuclease Cas4 (RecB family)
MSDILKKYAPWSLSKAQMASQCTLNFKFTYIDKLPRHTTTGSAARVGSAAHKCLELLLKGENINRAINVGAVDNKLVYNEIEELACMKDGMLDFINRLARWKSTHPVEKQFVEMKFGINEDFKPTGFWDKDAVFRGAFDLGMKTQKNGLVIIDHKSGTEKAISAYKDQLNCYALSGQILFPEITGVDTAVHYIQSKNIVWGDYIPSEKIKSELFPWLVAFLEQATYNVDSEIAKPTKGWFCNFCSYKPICPAWNDTKVATPIEADVPLAKNDPSNI